MKEREYIFISNVDLSNRRGGWDGLGGKLYDMLTEILGQVRLLDKVNPPIRFFDKAWSKLFRLLGLPAIFPAFSSARLSMIRQILSRQIPASAGLLIFHGSTPWVHYQPAVKYCVLLDCSFITYLEVYHDAGAYSKRDVKRIRDAEKQFLSKATYVYFTSQWALKETCRHYNLSGDNMVVMGQGPSMQLDDVTYHTRPLKKQFLFIATNFLGKGGAEICRCFDIFCKKFKGYELLIAGEQPPNIFLQNPAIRYLGYINKSSLAGRQLLVDLYEETLALLMMTSKDIAPLVIIEAGWQGCPAVSNNVSAIGEMIIDGETGFLVGNREQELLDRMQWFAVADQRLLAEMRAAVKQFVMNTYSWDKVSGIITRTLFPIPL